MYTNPCDLAGFILEYSEIWLIPLWNLPIFQQFWEYGEVPIDWKLVNVVPVFKKGKKEHPDNYRPVSLTSATVIDLATQTEVLGKHVVIQVFGCRVCLSLLLVSDSSSSGYACGGVPMLKYC